MWTTCPGSLTVNAAVRIESQVQRPNTTKPLRPSTCPHLFALWLTTLLFVRRSFGDGSHVDRIGGGDKPVCRKEISTKRCWRLHLMWLQQRTWWLVDLHRGCMPSPAHVIDRICELWNRKLTKENSKFELKLIPPRFFPENTLLCGQFRTVSLYCVLSALLIDSLVTRAAEAG